MGAASDTSLQAFVSHIHRTRSAATAKKYAEAATKFLRTMKFNGITQFEKLPRNVLQLFVDTMVGDYAPASVHVYLAGAQKYLGWVRNQGVFVPELLSPETPKVPHRMRDSLSLEDMSVYFDQAEDLPEPAKTAVILLPCTGLRAQEMVELPLSSIHKVSVLLDDGTRKNTLALSVIGKGDKERSVPILDEGVEALMTYLAGERKRLPGPWVFPGMISKWNKHGAHPMSVRLLRDAVARVREPLGMEITPHTMRRTYLTSLWRMGVDAPTIAKIAGHANIQTLFKHYLALDEQDVLRAVYSKGRAWT
jgi:site-specific recombinase XerD